jgi:hypothetical protein
MELKRCIHEPEEYIKATYEEKYKLLKALKLINTNEEIIMKLTIQLETIKRKNKELFAKREKYKLKRLKMNNLQL